MPKTYKAPKVATSVWAMEVRYGPKKTVMTVVVNAELAQSYIYQANRDCEDMIHCSKSQDYQPQNTFSFVFLFLNWHKSTYIRDFFLDIQGTLLYVCAD